MSKGYADSPGKLDVAECGFVVGIILFEVLTPELLAKCIVRSAVSRQNVGTGRGEERTHLNVITRLCFASDSCSFPVDNGSWDTFMGSLPSASSPYSPVKGSTCGAPAKSSDTIKLASPTWSFDDSLSQCRRGTAL